MVSNKKGIVLKTIDYKEKDKIMWLFTEDEGKISVFCRNVRSPKNRYQSMIRSLVFADFTLYKGKGMYTFNEGLLINSFKGLMESFEEITYATYYLELVDITSMDKDPNPLVYKNLLVSLYLMETKVLDNTILTFAFEIKHILYSGFKISREEIPFSVSQGALNIIGFFEKTSLDRIHVLKLDESMKKELREILNFIIEEKFQRIPKSLEMLKIL